MDTLQTVINLIKDLGFPIAVCIAMFWLNNKQVEQHKEEMTKVTDALNNNTLALTELRDRLDKK
nr:MAG TPA: YvrJ protein family protein [Caudoviricetes sp.]